MMDNDEIVVRKLIPLEYWRLMDFDDEDFERARAAMNDLFIMAPTKARRSCTSKREILSSSPYSKKTLNS